MLCCNSHALSDSLYAIGISNLRKSSPSASPFFDIIHHRACDRLITCLSIIGIETDRPSYTLLRCQPVNIESSSSTTCVKLSARTRRDCEATNKFLVGSNHCFYGHGGKHLRLSTSAFGIGSNSAISMTDCHSHQPYRIFMWLSNDFLANNCRPGTTLVTMPIAHFEHSLLCAYVSRAAYSCCSRT